MAYVVISGKGGTGKTTIAAAFAYLSETHLIKADCDVDASNLHLMFRNAIRERKAFKGAKLAEIRSEQCMGCDLCRHYCRFDAIVKTEEKYQINPLKCEGCGACKVVCKQGAIQLNDEITGETRIYDSEKGILAGASMIPGAEGSGKLVTQVRKQAKLYAEPECSEILIDGSPGIGCAVMASVTGCQWGIIVTEPTLSGYEDFIRIHGLLKHFNCIPLTIVNKYDINLERTQKIETYCEQNEITLLGRVPFDPLVERSVNEGNPVVTYDESLAAKAIKEIWQAFMKIKEAF